MAKTKAKEILQSDDPFKEKLTYFWEYYKWHVIGGILLVFFIIYMGFQWFGRTQVGYHVGILGPALSDPQIQALQEEVSSELETETVEGDVIVTATPTGQMSERFFAQLTAGEYDLILISEEAYESFGADGGMTPFVTEDINDSGLYFDSESEETVGLSSDIIPVFSDQGYVQNLVALVPSNSLHKPLTQAFFNNQEVDLTLEYLD